MLVFENNREAINKMPRSLLSAFNNRSWIPVTNILSRFCKGSGFASSKNGESSSSFSGIFKCCYFWFNSLLFLFNLIVMQTNILIIWFPPKVLLRETCIHEQELFFSFLNRLFNTLSWTMTEFSMSIREMQDKNQVDYLFFYTCVLVGRSLQESYPLTSSLWCSCIVIKYS